MRTARALVCVALLAAAACGERGAPPGAEPEPEPARTVGASATAPGTLPSGAMRAVAWPSPSVFGKEWAEAPGSLRPLTTDYCSATSSAPESRALVGADDDRLDISMVGFETELEAARFIDGVERTARECASGVEVQSRPPGIDGGKALHLAETGDGAAAEVVWFRAVHFAVGLRLTPGMWTVKLHAEKAEENIEQMIGIATQGEGGAAPAAEPGSLAAALAAAGVDDALLRRHQAARVANGYGATGASDEEDVESSAVVAVGVCRDVASGRTTWEAVVAEDVANGAPEEAADGYYAFLRAEFCPAVR